MIKDSTAFFNASAKDSELSLFLDINPNSDIIKNFFYEGPQAQIYKDEMEELRLICLDKPLDVVKKINRSSLKSETLLPSKNLSVLPRGLSLLRTAIATYTGEGGFLKEQTDVVCLCFTVSKKDIVKNVFSNKDFELKTLIQNTHASSACGSCRPLIEKIMKETRLENGLIKGLDHSKSRFDSEGNWIKIAGMYPGPLLIKLEELKADWMKREKIEGQFEIEFIGIEGFHLTMKINSDNEKIVKGLMSALTDYLKSELGVLFFLET